jgi:putative transposase
MDMKLSRFTEEQIIGILRQQEAGARTADVCRKYGISGASFYKWKAQYGGLEVSHAQAARLAMVSKQRLASGSSMTAQRPKMFSRL